MNMKKNINFVILILSMFFLIFSCSVPSGGSGGGKINHVENFTFEQLKASPYLGGGLIYSEQNKSVSHLSKGLQIPVRLGEMESIYDDELGDYILQDISENAKYGLIIIDEIGNENIDIYYKIYNFFGKVIMKKNYSLGINEVLDIDRDGDDDLSYIALNQDRAGFENSMQLKFICSEEKLSTTMFCLLPDSFDSKKYPSGIMGVNPNGKFLIKNDDVPSKSVTRSGDSDIFLISKNEPRIITDGDFVFNSSTGKAAEVSSVVDYGNSLRAVADYSADDYTVMAVPFLYFKFEGTLDEVEKMYKTPVIKANDEFTEGLQKIYDMLNQYHKYKILDWEEQNYDFDVCKLTIKDFKAYIGIKFELSISLKKVGAKASVALMAEGGLRVEGNIGNQVYNLLNMNLFNLDTGFWIGPVYISIGVPVDMRVDLELYTDSNFALDVDVYAMYGAGASTGVKLKWCWIVPCGIKPYFNTNIINEFNMRVNEISIPTEASVRLKPTLIAEARVGLYGIVYVKAHAEGYVAPRLTGRLAESKLQLIAALDAGASLGVGAGATLLFWNWSTPIKNIFEWEDTIWEAVLIEIELFKNRVYEEPLIYKRTKA
ncbi:MAG: hypothetical protein JXB50_11245 [Spirochaetes bacterium]|nr:hypothetical protein [Spirochaetota bacterium]